MTVAPRDSIPAATPPELGGYRLLDLLGRGGMGEVYRAEREGPGGYRRRAALKRILPRYQNDPTLRARFLSEARINARLEHPNIVQVLDFGEQPEPYLALEYVEGTTVARVLKHCADTGERLPAAAAAYVVAEVATGLDYAHRRRDENGNALQIVHRDVSPQNILLSLDGAVKVSDFGIARAADNQLRTAVGVSVGKLAYMAPEQASGGTVDCRADVFAMGIVLWEMLLVRPLIPRNDSTGAIQMLLAGRFDPPSRIDPRLPPTLDRIVLDALAVDPARRPPSAGHLAQALRGFLHSVAPGFDGSELVRILSKLAPIVRWQVNSAPRAEGAPAGYPAPPPSGSYAPPPSARPPAAPPPVLAPPPVAPPRAQTYGAPAASGHYAPQQPAPSTYGAPQQQGYAPQGYGQGYDSTNNDLDAGHEGGTSVFRDSPGPVAPQPAAQGGYGYPNAPSLPLASTAAPPSLSAQANFVTGPPPPEAPPSPKVRYGSNAPPVAPAPAPVPSHSPSQPGWSQSAPPSNPQPLPPTRAMPQATPTPTPPSLPPERRAPGRGLNIALLVLGPLVVVGLLVGGAYGLYTLTRAERRDPGAPGPQTTGGGGLGVTVRPVAPPRPAPPPPAVDAGPAVVVVPQDQQERRANTALAQADGEARNCMRRHQGASDGGVNVVTTFDNATGRVSQVAVQSARPRGNFDSLRQCLATAIHDRARFTPVRGERGSSSARKTYAAYRPGTGGDGLYFPFPFGGGGSNRR